ncbi:APC family permease [Streptomyces albiflaviniger]|nr:APC family permease [Streptomyces albiflaviniger]
MTFATMMGSGWLLASYYAAQVAGPLAIVSWTIAGVATMLVGLVYSHLGVAWPLAGGNVRWPRLTSGPFVGAVIGWAAFVQISVATPGEATAILQYISQWWPAVFRNGHLTTLGLFVAVAVLALFVVLNFFGVLLMARLNNVLTAFKLIIPALAVVLFIYSGFDSGNIEAGGGAAPFGVGASLTAVTGAGLLFAFAGVITPAVMSGEARNPRKDVPLGTLVAVGTAFAIYVGLQVAYLLGAPTDQVSHGGWSGVNLHSPFAQIAVFLNLHWMGTLLLVDSVVAPSGTLFTSTAWKARVTYGLAENRTLPHAVSRIHARSGIPRRALLLNLVVAVLFLLLFQSWHELVKVAGFFLAIVYAGASVAAGAIDLHPHRIDKRPWLRHAHAVGGLSFILSGLLIYWSGWQNCRNGLLILVALFLLYLATTHFGAGRAPWSDIAGGAWMGVLILGVVAASFVGSYGGHGNLSEPWGSLLVALFAALCYWWGSAKAKAYILVSTPDRKPVAAE